MSVQRATTPAIDLLARRLRCVEEPDFRAWAKQAQRAAGHELTALQLFRRFCQDCTKRYRGEQRAGGRCIRPVRARVS